MDQRNAVVTGASRGIGHAIVEKFAQNNVNVWACASRQNPEFETDMKKMEEKYHVWIRPLYFDLKNEDEIKHAVCTIRDDKCPIDILVNNAGISKVANLSMMSMTQIRDIFECNFFGPLYLIQYIQKMMIKSSGGVIINIGSISGLDADKGYAAYGSSKAAFMFLSKVLAKELKPYHIRVNAVAPGIVGTEMISYKTDELISDIIEATWLKRTGTPQEIANVVYFLTTKGASHITGEIIRVDGGKNHEI